MTLKLVRKNPPYGLEEYKRERDKLEFYEDMRDNLMSLVKNSGLSFVDIQDHCGPCPQTLEAWASGRVRKPQLGKMRATLHIIGKKFRDIE